MIRQCWKSERRTLESTKVLDEWGNEHSGKHLKDGTLTFLWNIKCGMVQQVERITGRCGQTLEFDDTDKNWCVDEETNQRIIFRS